MFRTQCCVSTVKYDIIVAFVTVLMASFKLKQIKECLNDVQNEKMLTVLSQSSNERLGWLKKSERMHDHA